jgi:hypothetical protein
VGKFLGKWPLGRLRRRWEVNIEMEFIVFWIVVQYHIVWWIPSEL